MLTIDIHNTSWSHDFGHDAEFMHRSRSGPESGLVPTAHTHALPRPCMYFSISTRATGNGQRTRGDPLPRQSACPALSRREVDLSHCNPSWSDLACYVFFKAAGHLCEGGGWWPSRWYVRDFAFEHKKPPYQEKANCQFSA